MRPPPAAFAPSTPATSAAGGAAAKNRGENAGPASYDASAGVIRNGADDERIRVAHGSGDVVTAAVTPSQHQSLETEVDYEIGDLILREELANGENGREGSTEHLPTVGDARRNESPASRGSRIKSCFLHACLCRCLHGPYSRSLASAPTTSWLATLGVPIMVVVVHVLFYHGQTADMWKLQSSANVDCWYNASSLEAKSVFRIAGLGDPYNIHVQVHDNSTVQTFTYYTAIQELWDAAGMDVNVFLPRLASVLLILFSGVWPHLKLLLLNVHWLLRPNSPNTFWWLSTLGKWSLSDVLVVCLMLGILHIDWNVEPSVVLQGIIHQAPTIMKVLPDLYNTSEICTYMLHRPCTERFLMEPSHHSFFSTEQSWNNDTEAITALPHFLDWDLGCSACLKFVESSLAHPYTFQSTVQGVADGIDTSGGGLVTLRVQGLIGIYSFCAAVVLSIALSCLVDIYSIRAAANTRTPSAPAATSRPPPSAQQQEQQPRARIASCERPLLDSEEGRVASESPHGDDRIQSDLSPSPEDDVPVPEVDAHLTHRYAPLNADDPASAHNGHHQLIRTTSSLSLSTASTLSARGAGRTPQQAGAFSCRSFWHTCATILSVVTAVIVGKTLQAPSLSREVVGVGPHWLQQVTGVRWDTTFSLTGLAAAIGEAGGSDALLQATFAGFCVVGPAVRAILCVVALCCPRQLCGTSVYDLLLVAIEFVGAFCAVEVLAVAAYLVHMLIPSTTATIVNVPQCAQIAPENSTSSCFEVYLEPQDSFQWLVIGTLLLLVVSQACHWLLPVKKRSRNAHR